MIKKFFMSILLLTIITSCTNDDDFADLVSNGEQGGKFSINVKIEPFKTNDAPLTRGYLGDISSNNEELDFYFLSGYEDEDEDGNPIHVEGDKFGICSLATPYINIPLEIVGDDDPTKDEVGNTNLSLELRKSLVKGDQYIVYYPYRSGFHTTSAYRYFDFHNQKQNGVNNSDVVASNYCYFSSEVFTYNGNDISNVSLHADNSVLRLQLKLPKGTYKKIELVNIDGLKPFYGYARSTITSDGFKIINSPKLNKENSLTLNLLNSKVTKANQYYNFYLSVNPTKTGNFVVKATKSDGSVYYSTKVFDCMEFKAGYGYTLKCSMSKTKPFNDDNTENAIRYVDLGTSVYWATLNVGALSPSELGDRYAWGELVAEGENLDEYSVKKRTDYTWENYKWNKDGKFEKYGYLCPTSDVWFPSTYKMPILRSEDDIASQLFGGKWRVPSVAEMNELRDECFWETTNDYKGSGVKGFIVYKAKCVEDKSKFYNHNGDNGVVPKCNYNVEDDVHIFIPSVYDESQGYNRVCYLSNQTAWNKFQEGIWNNFCISMYIYDVLDRSDRPSIMWNVLIDNHTSWTTVYKPNYIRPVCDKK